MKLLMLTDDLRQGGAERQLCLLAALMAREGHEVRIVQFYPHPVFYRRELLEAGVSVQTVEGVAPMTRIFAIRHLCSLWRPDAALAFKEGSALALALARPKCRVAVSERNSNPTDSFSLRQQLKYLIFRRADAVVCNSHTQFDRLKMHFPSLAPKLSLITNALPEPGVPSASEPHSSPLILVAARIARQKNPENFLRALALLPAPTRALWRGRCEDPALRRRLISLADGLGISHRIDFQDETSDMASLYARADVVCIPSLHEGFSNVLCEAMAAGKVCVASRAGDNDRILSRQDRLFCPGCPEDIARALKAALALSRQERKCEGEENAHKAVQMCNPGRFCRQWSQVLFFL